MIISKTESFIRDDGSELVAYDKPDFPALLRKNFLPKNVNLSSARSHWHEDIEFISVITGSIKYNVNGDVMTIRQGDGLFVNSRQFHFIISDEGRECTLYCAVMHPMLLCALQKVEEKYVSPLIADSKLPYILLKGESSWQNEILQYINDMCESAGKEGYELIVQALFFRLWSVLFANANILPAEKSSENHHLAILKNMVAFIHEHYNEKLALEDICAAGGVGKTLCTEIFRRCVNSTPMIFLTEYRLKKAAELLLETDMNITEIAYETGFAGASYFAERFRRSFGCSPREYAGRRHNI